MKSLSSQVALESSSQITPRKPPLRRSMEDRDRVEGREGREGPQVPLEERIALMEQRIQNEAKKR